MKLCGSVKKPAVRAVCGAGGPEQGKPTAQPAQPRRKRKMLLI